MPAVILAKYIDGERARIEVRSPLVIIPPEHLEHMARAAKEQGFDLMYEFDNQPSMVDVTTHFRMSAAGRATKTLPGMTRLWVLADLKELLS